ncbi:MAG: heparan-alpha-glucosaminide N-acetyltransferase domain-containing protein [Vicinamibacterales bacterium]
MSRLRYLDWLRGAAIILMVEAHVVDAWTRPADRAGAAYYAAVFAGGLAAPLFLFLAGAGIALAGERRAAAGQAPSAVASGLRRRGWQILLLALLFRVQAQLLGWGALVNLLRVDILNAMGPAMVAGAVLWQAGRTRGGRIALAASAAAAVSLATPAVWHLPALAALPDPIEAYARPAGGLSLFPLFPWAAFLLAGVAVGEGVAATWGRRSHDWLQAGFLAGGLGLALGSLWASYQPPIFATADFWADSPAFFGLRLGLSVALVAAAWAHYVFWVPGADPAPTAPARVLAAAGRSLPRPVTTLSRGLSGAVETMGRSSLFVYWVHVEMVYGLAAYPLKGRLPLAASLAATAALAWALHALVVWKNRRLSGVRLAGAWRVFAPVLK